MIAQYILLFLMTLGLGISIFKHGEERPIKKYNAKEHFIVYLVILTMLYFFGFFD